MKASIEHYVLDVVTVAGEFHSVKHLIWCLADHMLEHLVLFSQSISVDFAKTHALPYHILHD